MMNIAGILPHQVMEFEAARERLTVSKGYTYLRAYLNPWSGAGAIVDYDKDAPARLALEARGFRAVSYAIVFPKDNPNHESASRVRSKLASQLRQMREDLHEVDSVVTLSQERFGVTPEAVTLLRRDDERSARERARVMTLQYRLHSSQISGD